LSRNPEREGPNSTGLLRQYLLLHKKICASVKNALALTKRTKDFREKVDHKKKSSKSNLP
jgi:hypothetical protein